MRAMYRAIAFDSKMGPDLHTEGTSLSTRTRALARGTHIGTLFLTQGRAHTYVSLSTRTRVQHTPTPAARESHGVESTGTLPIGDMARNSGVDAVFSCETRARKRDASTHAPGEHSRL